MTAAPPPSAASGTSLSPRARARRNRRDLSPAYSQRLATDDENLTDASASTPPSRSVLARVVGIVLPLAIAAALLVGVLPAIADFSEVWDAALGSSLAEWLGHPAHVEGELMILDSDRRGLNNLVAAVAREHPGVNLRIEPSPTVSTGVRITARAAGHDERARRAVDAALGEVERAASAARLQVSSTGRIAAHVVGIGS